MVYSMTVAIGMLNLRFNNLVSGYTLGGIPYHTYMQDSRMWLGFDVTPSMLSVSFSENGSLRLNITYQGDRKLLTIIKLCLRWGGVKHCIVIENTFKDLVITNAWGDTITVMAGHTKLIDASMYSLRRVITDNKQSNLIPDSIVRDIKCLNCPFLANSEYLYCTASPYGYQHVGCVYTPLT